MCGPPDQHSIASRAARAHETVDATLCTRQFTLHFYLIVLLLFGLPSFRMKVYYVILQNLDNVFTKLHDYRLISSGVKAKQITFLFIILVRTKTNLGLSHNQAKLL